MMIEGELIKTVGIAIQTGLFGYALANYYKTAQRRVFWILVIIFLSGLIIEAIGRLFLEGGL